MRWWVWPFKLVGLLLLAALLSGAWLFRGDLERVLRPRVTRLADRVQGLGSGVGDRRPAPAPSVEDKVDSLHGWAADSVLLSAREMADLIRGGLPAEARARLDSLTVQLGTDRVTLTGRLATRDIPKSALGPLAGALAPWERVAGTGLVVVTGPGRAEWRVDGLTLRGFTLPAPASRDLVSRAVPGVHDGAVPFRLPPGVTSLRVRPTGVTLYPGAPR